MRVVSRNDRTRDTRDLTASLGLRADSLQVLRDGAGPYFVTPSGPVPAPPSSRDAFVEGRESLGISVAQPGKDLLKQMHCEPQGLIIMTVTPSSRAARAGLRPGDIIERVNRLPLFDVEMLRSAVRTMSHNPLLLQVTRRDARFYITASAW